MYLLSEAIYVQLDFLMNIALIFTLSPDSTSTEQLVLKSTFIGRFLTHTQRYTAVMKYSLPLVVLIVHALTSPVAELAIPEALRPAKRATSCTFRGLSVVSSASKSHTSCPPLTYRVLPSQQERRWTCPSWRMTPQ